MISLDTNVLVRFLLDESEAPGLVDVDYIAQRTAAQRLVHGALMVGTNVFLCSIVLAELVWVLRIFYKVKKADIVAKLDQLVAHCFDATSGAVFGRCRCVLDRYNRRVAYGVWRNGVGYGPPAPRLRPLGAGTTDYPIT